MYTLSESELIFLLDLFRESISSDEVFPSEFEEAVDLIEGVLTHNQTVEVACG